MSTNWGPQTPHVSTVAELHDIVAAVKEAGEFAFDVETRGHIDRHADVMALVKAEQDAKRQSLKSDHESVVAKSMAAIESAWTKALALDPLRNEVFWIGIATAGGQSWAIPMGHPNGETLVSEFSWKDTIAPPGYRELTKTGKESMKKCSGFIPAVFDAPPPQLTQGEVFGVLHDIFADPNIVKINQNIKFDAKSVAKYLDGQLPAGLYVDIQTLKHIDDENLIKYDFQTILDATFSDKRRKNKYTDEWEDDITTFDPYKRDGKIGSRLDQEPFSKVCRYVHYDARWAYLTYKWLWEKLSKNEGLYRALLLDTECTRTVAKMEMNGILVNKRELEKLGKELDLELNRIKSEMVQYTPLDFNPDSNPDKQKLLFTKKREGGLGLKPSKVSEKTNKPSVDAEVLEDLRGEHPMVDLLLDYAEVKKIKSTYIEGMIPLMHNVGAGKWLGRVHPQFHFHRTATGRFSSSDPNLQNIPRDGRVRSLFVAGPGDSLVVADYSQIEMRIMAMFSQDPALLHIFENDIDVHTGTATVILGREPENSEERNIYGKTPNFLMGYGGGAKRLVAATGGQITMEQAQTIVDGYNKGYAGLTAWKADVLNKARRLGYVETLGGRRRRLPDLRADLNTKEGWRARTRAERQAINAVVQGTAAEICKRAMIELDRQFDWPKCKLLVQVHDELVSSVPTDELGIWIPVIEKAMGNDTILTDGVVAKGVKLVVEAHAAGSWYDAKG